MPIEEESVMAKKQSAAKESESKNRNRACVPGVPDQRDYLFGTLLPVPTRLPASVYLRLICSKVEDHRQLGSCVSNALIVALEFLEKKDKVALEDFTRLFIYYKKRAIEHKMNSDSGAMIRDVIRTPAYRLSNIFQ
jgi:hypothetical protein